MLVDLDGVLLRGDAFTSVVIQALIQRPWKLLAAVLLLALRGTTRRLGERRIRLNRALVRLALGGYDSQSYDRLADAVGTRLGCGPKRIAPLIEEVGTHLDDAMRVIVVTASECRVARSFLDAVGLGKVELSATDLTFPLGEPAGIGTYNLGAQKVRSVVARGIDPARCLFYTDSATDLPLIEAVANCILVEPSPATRRVIRAADVATPLEILKLDKDKVSFLQF